MTDAPAITSTGLKVHFQTAAGLVRAVDGVDLTVASGAFHGIVGESGCGKTTLARALIGLQSATAGQVQILGRDRADWARTDCKGIARAVQFIFQDPLGSMSRRQSVGQTLEEPLQIHGMGDQAARRKRWQNCSTLWPCLRRCWTACPGRCRGGQRQRVSIARALALSPQLLICDEPL